MTSEADFKQAWRALPERADLFRLALDGGALADSLSHVFIAAYQCAIRECFAGLKDDRWYCYAASEDRSGNLPGVSITNGRLSGTKTWIASSDCVDEIIVVVDGNYHVVPSDATGVSIETVPDREFLGDMSQGRATFSGAEPTAQPEMTGNFGLAEAFYVTASSTGYLATRFEEHQPLKTRVMDCAKQLDELRFTEPGALLPIHEELKALGRQCAAEVDTEGELADDWARSGRLLAMYGRAFKA
jgi:hypothetical protein